MQLCNNLNLNHIASSLTRLCGLANCCHKLHIAHDLSGCIYGGMRVEKGSQTQGWGCANSGSPPSSQGSRRGAFKQRVVCASIAETVMAAYSSSAQSQVHRLNALQIDAFRANRLLVFLNAPFLRRRLVVSRPCGVKSEPAEMQGAWPRAVVPTAACTATDSTLHLLAQPAAAACRTVGGARHARKRIRSLTNRSAPPFQRPPTSAPSTTSLCGPVVDLCA